MRLNPDCIRDILLTVEEKADLDERLFFRAGTEPSYERLASYSMKEVVYHIRLCDMSGMLSRVNWYDDNSCFVFHLSPYGHEFIENIRNNNNWEKTKSIAKSVGSTSLQAIVQIASSVIAELITKRV